MYSRKQREKCVQYDGWMHDDAIQKPPAPAVASSGTPGGFHGAVLDSSKSSKISKESTPESLLACLSHALGTRLNLEAKSNKEPAKAHGKEASKEHGKEPAKAPGKQPDKAAGKEAAQSITTLQRLLEEAASKGGQWMLLGSKTPWEACIPKNDLDWIVKKASHHLGPQDMLMHDRWGKGSEAADLERCVRMGDVVIMPLRVKALRALRRWKVAAPVETSQGKSAAKEKDLHRDLMPERRKDITAPHRGVLRCIANALSNDFVLLDDVKLRFEGTQLDLRHGWALIREGKLSACRFPDDITNLKIPAKLTFDVRPEMLHACLTWQCAGGDATELPNDELVANRKSPGSPTAKAASRKSLTESSSKSLKESKQESEGAGKSQKESKQEIEGASKSGQAPQGTDNSKKGDTREFGTVTEAIAKKGLRVRLLDAPRHSAIGEILEIGVVQHQGVNVKMPGWCRVSWPNGEVTACRIGIGNIFDLVKAADTERFLHGWEQYNVQHKKSAGAAAVRRSETDTEPAEEKDSSAKKKEGSQGATSKPSMPAASAAAQPASSQAKPSQPGHSAVQPAATVSGSAASTLPAQSATAKSAAAAGYATSPSPKMSQVVKQAVSQAKDKEKDKVSSTAAPKAQGEATAGYAAPAGKAAEIPIAKSKVPEAKATSDKSEVPAAKAKSDVPSSTKAAEKFQSVAKAVAQVAKSDSGFELSLSAQDVEPWQFIVVYGQSGDSGSLLIWEPSTEGGSKSVVPVRVLLRTAGAGPRPDQCPSILVVRPVETQHHPTRYRVDVQHALQVGEEVRVRREVPQAIGPPKMGDEKRAFVSELTGLKNVGVDMGDGAVTYVPGAQIERSTGSSILAPLACSCTLPVSFISRQPDAGPPKNFSLEEGAAVRDARRATSESRGSKVRNFCLVPADDRHMHIDLNDTQSLRSLARNPHFCPGGEVKLRWMDSTEAFVSDCLSGTDFTGHFKKAVLQ